MMNERSSRFLSLLRHGTRDDRLAILSEVPSSQMKDASSYLVESDAREMQVVGLSTLIMAFGFGEGAAIAADLARGAYPYAREVYEHQAPGRPLLLPSVSAIAASGLHALNLLGQYDSTVEFADEVIPDLEELSDEENLPHIYAHRIEALIGLHRIDDATDAMTSAEKQPRQSPHLLRLKKELEVILQSPTDLPGDASRAASMSPETYALLDVLLKEGEKLFTKSGEEMNEWKANAALRRIGSLFLQDMRGREGELRQGLADLAPLELWARTNGHTDIHNDTLWETYLCHSRLGAWTEAATTLQQLRRNVEKRRAGIADPLKRAGVGAKFPNLYPALCQMLQNSGRTDELLGAMEGAKGRAVADVMAQRSHTLIDEREFAEPAARMGELMRRHKAHYVSFFVDDDDTLAVLVAKDGSLHASGPIPLGKGRIRDACRSGDPRTWGERDLADLTGPAAEALGDALAPLVAWLQPHFESGLIEIGDHLSYSPDEHLHQLPLAYVTFMGKPLVETVSVSRTHGARTLSLILDRPSSRPPSFIAIEVPARKDRKNAKMVRDLRRAGAWLTERLPGSVFRDGETTIDAVCAADLAGRIVHFATHGVFPREDGKGSQNPFEYSGLALAGPDGPPDTGRIARGEDREKLLTPRRALESMHDLSGSHLTLQACVSGLAREGIGGDALGLDWALFQLGASSLLTSHWYVSAELSAEFAIRFYSAWIDAGHSRAAAWRETVLSMKGEDGPLSEPYAWAAFSLSGDWR